MLYSPLVTCCVLNITFYQRTLLVTSANQKLNYLKSYHNIQLMTLDEVNTTIYQPQKSDHRDHRPK
jgi:hypothetical protein